MTWVKIDDGFPEHPKVLRLSDAAFRLHLSALCYAARNLTDGVIPRVWVLVGKGRAVLAAVNQLLAAGLWTEHPDHYEIHDYLVYQQSRAQVEQQRERNSTRVKRHRNAVTPPLQHEPRNGPVTLPRIDPIPKDPKERTPPTITTPQTSSSPVVVSPLQFEKLRQKFAYVGARLRIPHVLHDECRTKLGGVDPHGKLLAWYAELDADIEQTGETLPDIFEWLRPKFVQWARDVAYAAELEKFRPQEA